MRRPPRWDSAPGGPTAPPDAPAHVVPPLIGRALSHDGLVGEAPAIWQTRLLAALATPDGPLDHQTLSRLLRPPPEARGRWSPALRKAMNQVRLRHPLGVLDGWLHTGVHAGILAEDARGCYFLGQALSAHDRLALTAAGVPR